jgi:hypothetical protein
MLESSLLVMLIKSFIFDEAVINAVSSAYITNDELLSLMVLGRSLINSKNNSGPRIEPCGTPCGTLNVELLDPSI